MSAYSTQTNDANTRRALKALDDKVANLPDVYPIIYQLDVTGRCNLSCLYCQRDFFRKTKHPFLKGDMPDIVFDRLLPYFKHAKMVALLSMLGEPLVVKSLPRWWKGILEAGAKPQTTTNGTYLTPELADMFTGTGGRLKISIDSFEQPVLDVLRPSMKAELLKDRLDLIERHRRQHPSTPFQLGVNLCLTSLNLHHAVETMEESLRRTRVDVFTFANFRLPRDEEGQFHEAARPLSLDVEAESFKDGWRRILRWAVERKRRDGVAFVFPYSRTEWRRLLGDDAAMLEEGGFEDRDASGANAAGYYCCVPWLKVNVLSDGSVIPCHLLQWTANEPVLGNVTRQTFEEIWNGEAYVNFRKNMAAGKRLGYCAQCTSWWRFYAPERVE